MDVDTIIRLLKFCLTTTVFQYRGTHYQQLDGLAMGSPVSPVIADIFMEDPEDFAGLRFAKIMEKVCGWRNSCDPKDGRTSIFK